ncbi:uncharacterized protein LOC119949967 [Tachyglossus aculeatus]|uniref:uncharacterized protein LOC119949967 n=1 Tax=Tachyglossus aculeatus TaxID=9261 RepID=UPI0018F45C0C|nr:uncharacterized protein LOC119949967 [Tachyglossus aculeatus]
MDENVQGNEKNRIDLALKNSLAEKEDENLSDLDSCNCHLCRASPAMKLKTEKWKAAQKVNNMDENVYDNENVSIELTLESSEEEEEKDIFISNVCCYICKASPGMKENIAKLKVYHKLDSMNEKEQENKDIFIDLTLETFSGEEEGKNLCSCYLCRANNGMNEQVEKWKEDQNANNMEQDEEENEEIFIDLTLESSSDEEEEEKISSPSLYYLCSHGANNGTVKELTEELKEQEMNKDKKNDQEEDECFIDFTLKPSDEEEEQLSTPELCFSPRYEDSSGGDLFLAKWAGIAFPVGCGQRLTPLPPQSPGPGFRLRLRAPSVLCIQTVAGDKPLQNPEGWLPTPQGREQAQVKNCPSGRYRTRGPRWKVDNTCQSFYPLQVRLEHKMKPKPGVSEGAEPRGIILQTRGLGDPEGWGETGQAPPPLLPRDPLTPTQPFLHPCCHC